MRRLRELSGMARFGETGRVVRLAAVVATASLLACAPMTAHALDVDILTTAQVNPNVLIVFDNSGSMGSQAYNTYPNTLYSGAYVPGTVYSRCRTLGSVSGGDVNSNCTCRNTQTGWVVDQSACATSFTDVQPPPSGDDTDDRESRRKRGNRLNYETTPPKNCTQSPFQSCTLASDCTGTGNTCSAQNKLDVAKSVMTSLVNDPDNERLRIGLEIFDPPGIDYSNASYSTSFTTSWQVNQGVYRVPVQDLNDTSRATLTSAIAALVANGATPTSHRLIDAWKYFNGQATASGFTTSPIQQVCQRNYVLLVTDGVPEVEGDSLVSPGTSCRFTRLQAFVGNPGDLNGDSKEVSTSNSWTLRTGESINCGSDYLDDAMIKIRGMYPLGNTANQPLALYAISFGFDYCEAPAPGDTSPGAGSLLWRASQRYGGGKCLSATAADELDDALHATLNLIKADAQSFVSPVVPVSQTNRLESGDRVYVALFSPRTGQQTWVGNLKKYVLDRDSGLLCNASAPNGQCTPTSNVATSADGTLLQTAESFWDGANPSGGTVTTGGVGGILLARTAARRIFTYTGSATGDLGGLDLSATAQAFSKANTAITPSVLGLTGVDATTANRDLLIDWIHGSDSFDENENGNTTERREWILGDIVHSLPVVVPYGAGDSAILVGANDGMLHAFDDATGEELWAFVPPDVLPKLASLRPGQSSSHLFLVDGAPRYRQAADGRKVVVFGLGRGGRAYYGLDVSIKSAPKLLWRVTPATSGYGELALATSTPVLTRWAGNGTTWEVAIFGAGTDPWFDSPTATTANPNGMGRAIYAANLVTGARVTSAQAGGMTFPIAGDVLAFDANGDGVVDRGYVGDLGGNLWRLSSDFAPTKLFSTPAGLRIFYPPDAVVNAGSVTVFFGTGDRNNPLSTGTTDRFYAVRDDGASNLTESSLVNVTSQVVQPGSAAATTLASQVRAAHGWFVTLDRPGEKMLATPTVFFNVAFTTFTPSTSPCESGGIARFYLLDPLVGSPTTDLAGTSGGTLGGGAAAGGGVGSGTGGTLVAADRSVTIGQALPTALKVTFGNDETKAFLGVSKQGGIALQPVLLPQVADNIVEVSWRRTW